MNDAFIQEVGDSGSKHPSHKGDLSLYLFDLYNSALTPRPQFINYLDLCIFGTLFEIDPLGSQERELCGVRRKAAR